MGRASAETASTEAVVVYRTIESEPANMTQPAHKRLLYGIALLVLLSLALFMRLHLMWDRGYLFHPDERQIYIIVDALSFPWPPDWDSLLSPSSPWNPGFFAYGSLPLYLLRICANLAGLIRPGLETLNDIHLVGRALSAAFDVGTVYLIYRLGRKLYDDLTGLLAATFAALAVLHIQLSHFYTVDTLLTFFVVLVVSTAVDLSRRPTLGRGLWLGATYGLALATKVSAAPLALVVGFAWVCGRLGGAARAKESAMHLRPALPWRRVIAGGVLSGLMALAVFTLCEPYALIDIVTFVVDVFHEGYMARGLTDIPYTRQFIGTLPYLYPLQQIVLWSLGLPLGIVGLAATLGAVVRALAETFRARWASAGEHWLPLAWVLAYFGLAGGFHVKFLRYMLPILPFLCLWAAWALMALVRATGRWRKLRRALGAVGLCVTLVGTALYAAAYLNIYRQPHPWIQATAWLCQNLPPESELVIEHWDDPLPMIQGTGDLRCHRKHEYTELQVYDPDDTYKLESLLVALERGDYIILSSNRLYNTIPRLPERYPLTSRYYELLMGEQLGYELVYYAAVYPRLFGVDLVNDTFCDPLLPRPKLLAENEARQPRINLGRADESYTVYDHPMPLVFKKTTQLSRRELLDLFGPPAQNLPEPSPKSND